MTLYIKNNINIDDLFFITSIAHYDHFSKIWCNLNKNEFKILLIEDLEKLSDNLIINKIKKLNYVKIQNLENNKKYDCLVIFTNIHQFY